VYLTSVDLNRNFQEVQLANAAELETDFETGIVKCCDPREYAAKMKLHDPDNPSFNEAMHGNETEQYVEAMFIEI
jgi:hypothetical protein